MTGIRSWTDRMSSFASVVRIEQVSMVSPSGAVHVSQIPAKLQGVPSRRVK